MKNARAVLAVAVALGAASAGPVVAAPKKPIEKHWDIVAPAPDPSNWAEQSQYSVCAQLVPGSYQVEEFSAPARGTIDISITGFEGDWDLLVLDDAGNEMGAGTSSDLGGTEKVRLKIKKKMDIDIIACNWAGTANAKGYYKFVYG